MLGYVLQLNYYVRLCVTNTLMLGYVLQLTQYGYMQQIKTKTNNNTSQQLWLIDLQDKFITWFVHKVGLGLDLYYQANISLIERNIHKMTKFGYRLCCS